MKGFLKRTENGWVVLYHKLTPVGKEWNPGDYTEKSFPLHPADSINYDFSYQSYSDEEIAKLKEVEFEIAPICNVCDTKFCDNSHTCKKDIIEYAKLMPSKKEEPANWDEIKLFIRNKIIENKQSREFVDWLTCLNMLEDYYNPPVKK